MAKSMQETIVPSAGVTQFDTETIYSPFPPGGKIEGTCSPEWEAVKNAFAKNFADGLELQAQLCIMQGNEVVVDLCGTGTHKSEPSGHAANASYSHDTVQAIFSSGKNLEAVIIAILVDRGIVKYSDCISKHWPAFGQNGKEAFTIADLMRHSAGLAYFIDPDDTNAFRKLTLEDINARDPMHQVIETSPPQNLKGTKRCYHSTTRGMVIDGLLKHVDPQARTIGQFARDEILAPLGVDDSYFVSLSLEESKKVSVADMRQLPTKFSLCHDFGPSLLGAGHPQIARIAESMSPESIISKSSWGIDWVSCGQEDPTSHSADFVNQDGGARATEATSCFSFASARAMTKIHSLFANGGEVDGVRIFSPETAKLAFQEGILADDDSLMFTSEMTQGGLGEMSTIKDSEDKYGAEEYCEGFYGWGGWGGSINVANPEKNITVSYAMTAMGNYIFADPRATNILKAVVKTMKTVDTSIAHKAQ